MMPPLIPSAKSARSDTGVVVGVAGRMIVAGIVPVVVAVVGRVVGLWPGVAAHARGRGRVGMRVAEAAVMVVAVVAVMVAVLLIAARVAARNMHAAPSTAMVSPEPRLSHGYSCSGTMCCEA